MPQKFLDRSDIIPILQQMGRERMSQRMTTGGLEHTGFQPSFFKRSLQNRLMEMMPGVFLQSQYRCNDWLPGTATAIPTLCRR